MQCATCQAKTLTPIQLEATLPAHTCASCGGTWIASTAYWSWLEQPRDAAVQPRAEIPEVSDVARAKRCPGCGYLLLSYPIAAGLAFHLDQCGHCNSFWLDRDEWAALRAAGLHDKLHKIAGEPWQRDLRQGRHRRAMQAIYAERFGAADYAEVQRVKAWLDAHPARSMLLAYLADEDPYRL